MFIQENMSKWQSDKKCRWQTARAQISVQISLEFLYKLYWNNVQAKWSSILKISVFFFIFTGNLIMHIRTLRLWDSKWWIKWDQKILNKTEENVTCWLQQKAPKQVYKLKGLDNWTDSVPDTDPLSTPLANEGRGSFLYILICCKVTTILLDNNLTKRQPVLKKYLLFLTKAN